jgi:hypothetical protein
LKEPKEVTNLDTPRRDAHTSQSDYKNSNQKRRARWEKIKIGATVFAAVLSLGALYALSRYNYLLFHGAVEVFSITIAFATFAIAWNSRRVMDNNYLGFIGIAFLFVAGLDLIHALAYKGMGVFPSVGANLATQLWIATRFVFATSLLIPLLLIRRKTRPSRVIAGYSLGSAVLVVSIFYWENFPTAYVDGVGLTAFKVGSEYAISLILLAAIGLLLKKRKEFSVSVFKLLLAAMAVAIATEMSFTLYSDVYGIANMIGHLLNVISFYLIYRALIETSLTKPYEMLFRNLKQSETNFANRAAEVGNYATRMEELAEERARQLKDSERLAAIGQTAAWLGMIFATRCNQLLVKSI